MTPYPTRPRGSGVVAAMIVIGAALAGTGVACAEDASPAGKLKIATTAYIWGSGLHGQQGLFGLPTTDVDVGFSDIFDKVDLAAAGIVTVQGEKLGFLGELNYVKLSAGARASGGVLSGNMDSKAFFALAAVTYRVADEDWGTVDAIGGLKYFRFDNAVTLSPGPLSASDAQSWTDVTVGAKAAIPLSPRWTLQTWAMVGGGGSDLSWDVLAAFDYRINDKWSAAVGYRAMGVDYASGGFTYDMTQSGPIIGVTARF